MLELKDLRLTVKKEFHPFVTSVFEVIESKDLKTVEEWNMLKAEFFKTMEETSNNPKLKSEVEKILFLIFDYSGIIKKLKLKRQII